MDDPTHTPADEPRWPPPVAETLVERRIREAMERGEFDDLPGMGEPLPDAGEPYDELWWLERWLKRNDVDPRQIARLAYRARRR